MLSDTSPVPAPVAGGMGENAKAVSSDVGSAEGGVVLDPVDLDVAGLWSRFAAVCGLMLHLKSGRCWCPPSVHYVWGRLDFQL